MTPNEVVGTRLSAIRLTSKDSKTTMFIIILLVGIYK